MNKCDCCGKSFINLVKVEGLGMCCKHCANVISMELEERKLNNDNNKLVYDYVENHGLFVDDSGEAIPEEAILFYVNDSKGIKHFFSIYTLTLREDIVAYTASEIYEKGSVPVTNYEFKVGGCIEKQEELISELLLKTAKGINNTTLEFGYGMASVKSTGQMEIVYSEDYDGEYGYKIDGKNYSPNAAIKLFRPYEGWRFLFQAADSFDDVLEKDALLMPIVMNENTFVDELKELIMIFSDGNLSEFISYKNMMGFDILFKKLIDKLQFYFLNYPSGVGKIAGMKMIRTLENIDSDDDLFPEYYICLIRDAISKNEEFNHSEIV